MAMLRTTNSMQSWARLLRRAQGLLTERQQGLLLLIKMAHRLQCCFAGRQRAKFRLTCWCGLLRHRATAIEGHEIVVDCDRAPSKSTASKGYARSRRCIRRRCSYHGAEQVRSIAENLPPKCAAVRVVLQLEGAHCADSVTTHSLI